MNRLYRILYPIIRKLGLPEPLMYGSVSRLIYFSFLYEQIKDVKGSIVECGVGWGNSLLLLGFLIRQEQLQPLGPSTPPKPSRILYGFDSFGLGFPLTAQMDGAKEGAWKTTEKSVKRLFRNSRCGIHPVLVSGFFEKTLSRQPTGPVAFVHLDCDLYASYKEAIEELYPRMETGAIMTFDEYGSERWPGCTSAVNQFLLESGEQLRVYEPLHLRYIIKGVK